jgi:hypothetical protein
METSSSYRKRVDDPNHFRQGNYRIFNAVYYDARLLDNYPNTSEEATPEDSEYMRACYIRDTEAIIHLIKTDDFDSLVFLDKSARPVSWLMKELWPIFAGESKMPERYFANVDAADLMGLTGGNRPTPEEMAELEFSDEFLEEVRKVYADPQRPGKSLFDGKKVLIIDEITVTSSTQIAALKLFSEAFPEGNFEARALIAGDKKGNTVINNPIWYHTLEVEGRGVGDRVGPILSAPLLRKDERTDFLREDFKQLAKDILSGEQGVFPARENDPAFYKTDSNGALILDDSGLPILRFKEAKRPELKKSLFN